MMEAIILGSGTSTGVPLLGIDYPPEFLENPKNHRTRTALLLRGPQGNILVDCGPDMRLQLLRENIKSIDAVLITHTHADHVMGLDDLRSFNLITKRPMPIYTSQEYQQDIKRIFGYAFRELRVVDTVVPRFELHDIKEELELSGLKIKTVWVMHGNMPVLGLRVNNFAYLTDVNHIPEEAWAKLQGLDTLVLDAVRYKPHTTHFHLEKAIEVSRQLGAKQTYFTHLADEYDHDKVNAQLPQGIALAYDGLRISI